MIDPAVPATPPPTNPPLAGSAGLADRSPLATSPLEHTEGFSPESGIEENVDRRLAEIEMIGEESAVGWKPVPHEPLSPEVRYLHISRTINQLITDRNRSVGIFLGVASLLFAASTALLNARPDVVPIISLRSIQFWCLPVTFGTLAVIGVFMCLILIRTRIGLIYEVSKMNALLGLPSERVKRVNPLSIFFLMYLMVAVLGGACGGLFGGMLTMLGSGKLAAATGNGPSPSPVPGLEAVSHSSRASVFLGLTVGFLYVAGFLAAYYWMILNATTDSKLDKARK